MKLFVLLAIVSLPLCVSAQIITNPSKTSYLVEVFLGNEKLHRHVMYSGESFTIHKTTCDSRNITLTYQVHEFHCDKDKSRINTNDRNIQLPTIGHETKIIILKPCVRRKSKCDCGSSEGLLYVTKYYLPYNDCKIP